MPMLIVIPRGYEQVSRAGEVEAVEWAKPAEPGRDRSLRATARTRRESGEMCLRGEAELQMSLVNPANGAAEQKCREK
jgi:hypothetical protein